MSEHSEPEKRCNKIGVTQGHSTTTILTNRARNQTVIRPHVETMSERAPSLAKGTRWMHRTTLTLERNPHKDTMESSMDISYSGKYVASPPQRQRRCPTLHKSHIELGIGDKQYLKTHYDVEYPTRTIDHPNKVHYPAIVNWSHNVTGQDMKHALSRRNHTPNYWSSYTDVHSRFGLERGDGMPQPPRPKLQYNLITGQESSPVDVPCRRLTSGNRVLSQVRQQERESFVLG